MDCQSNSGVRGYSDIGGEGGYSSGYPWRVAIHWRSVVCQSNYGIRRYSRGHRKIAITVQRSPF